MKELSLKQFSIVFILALLTALEPLSIDLYLPGFIDIAKSFHVDSAAVQISLSTFLGGFAIGQLLWGPLADRYGRKKPIIASLILFTLASVACMYTKTIEQFWVVRALQAIGGCGGIVISRAVVYDYFEKKQVLNIFALLAMIMGVAPIVAPLIGNAIINHYHHWESLFAAMTVIGITLLLLTIFFLPETKKKNAQNLEKSSIRQIIRQYIEVIKVKKFVIYSLVAGFVNGVLMIYVSNGPFLIIEKGGFSSNAFSIIFATNAFGLILGSLSANIFAKRFAANTLCKTVLFLMTVVSIVMLLLMYFATIPLVLVALFCFLYIIGILFPLTTELALNSFGESNSGTASSLFGTIQMTIAFACTLCSGLMNDNTITTLGVEFVLCTAIAFLSVFGKVSK